MARTVSAIAIFLALFVTACGDSGPAQSPTAPSVLGRGGSEGVTQIDAELGDDSEEAGVTGIVEAASSVELEGTISGLAGACPSRTFTVDGETVLTSSSTTYKHGACSDLSNGDQVEVEGTRQADGVHATKIEFDED